MHEIGFWRKYNDDDGDVRPHPQSLQDKAWYDRRADMAAKVIWYVRHAGFVESYEMGYSFCRIDSSCSSKALGACTMTDGMYCWPEGYVHYLEQHHVVPPADFVEHVLQHVAAAVARPPTPFLVMWDYESRGPVPMPPTMQHMILANTTLTIGQPQQQMQESCALS
ncbi:hypothetical protein AaE_004691 [Aphanomyces astaci]|uniref:Uncharacterized protein n=1 Tax=Aphanomyces astaci TaxID=112090 RepID=A0A6A5A464_APHAT|nr:hypothetical protein AaE_004691 [Aphanomyces astaci]